MGGRTAAVRWTYPEVVLPVLPVARGRPLACRFWAEHGLAQAPDGLLALHAAVATDHEGRRPLWASKARGEVVSGLASAGDWKVSCTGMLLLVWDACKSLHGVFMLWWMWWMWWSLTSGSSSSSPTLASCACPGGLLLGISNRKYLHTHTYQAKAETGVSHEGFASREAH